MKKILIFSLAYYPSHVGGAEVAIKEITDRISPEEFEFHLITLRFDTTLSKIETIGNVTVHRVGSSGKYISKILYVPQSAWYAKQLHKQEQFEGVWVMMTYMLFPTVLMKLLGVRVPYVLTLQDGDPYERVMRRWFIRPFAPLLKYGFRHATLVQSISTHLASWATQLEATCQTHIIPNGVDMQTFSVTLTPEEREATRQQCSVPDTAVLLVSTSRLVHKNAYDDILHALKELPDTVHLLAVGKGQEEAKLKALVTELNLTSRVHFIGHVAYNDIPKYLAASDIFIRPSRSEGMGNSFIEAMATKLPVIATQEGGLADFIFDAKRNPSIPTTGWAVDKDSPKQIVKAVQEILANPEQTQKVVATAYTMVSQKFRWESIAKDMQTKIFSRLTTYE